MDQYGCFITTGLNSLFEKRLANAFLHLIAVSSVIAAVPQYKGCGREWDLKQVYMRCLVVR